VPDEEHRVEPLDPEVNRLGRDAILQLAVSIAAQRVRLDLVLGLAERGENRASGIAQANPVEVPIRSNGNHEDGVDDEEHKPAGGH
jgi:hypothetical protein